MAKVESTYLNMALTLVVITLIVSTTLGYVYEFTKEPIAAAKLAKQRKAIDAVVGEHDNDPLADKYKMAAPGLKDSLEVYPALRDGSEEGLAVKTFSPKGYGGNVWLMVGFLPDGTIKDISVLEHKETPGLGSKMSEPKFLDQFKNQNPEEFQLKVQKDGGNVDALTGATISSRAFSQAVQTAYDAIKEGGTSE